MLFGLLALVVTSCTADFGVFIVVDEDGSGTIKTELVLDAEAAAEIVDLNADSSGLPLADLATSGWNVSSPSNTSDGGMVIAAEKRFGNDVEFEAAMNEISGNEGVIKNFDLLVEQSFGSVDYTVSGSLDTTGGLSSFSDDDLETALGAGIASIAERYETQPQDITLKVDILLPGAAQENVSTGEFAEVDNTVQAVWETNMASDTAVEVALGSTRRSIVAQVLRGAALVAGVLALLLVFAQLARAFPQFRHKQSGRKATKLKEGVDRSKAGQLANGADSPVAVGGSKAAGSSAKSGLKSAAQTGSPTAAENAKASAATEPEGPKTRIGYRVVALDGMGVLYSEGNDIGNLLVPFAREKGSRSSKEEIAAKARLLSLGRLTTKEFWTAIGVNGEVNRLDDEYVATHQLTPGVVKYLRWLRDDGVKVACVTNDCVTWAMKLRSKFSLEGLVDPWVVSGSVGVRKPDAPIFDVLRRLTGTDPASILIIDDNLATLDAASELGFATTWFGRASEQASEVEAPTVAEAATDGDPEIAVAVDQAGQSEASLGDVGDTSDGAVEVKHRTISSFQIPLDKPS